MDVSSTSVRTVELTIERRRVGRARARLRPPRSTGRSFGGFRRRSPVQDDADRFEPERAQRPDGQRTVVDSAEAPARATTSTGSASATAGRQPSNRVQVARSTAAPSTTSGVVPLRRSRAPRRARFPKRYGASPRAAAATDGASAAAERVRRCLRRRLGDAAALTSGATSRPPLDRRRARHSANGLATPTPVRAHAARRRSPRSRPSCRRPVWPLSRTDPFHLSRTSVVDRLGGGCRPSPRASSASLTRGGMNDHDVAEQTGDISELACPRADALAGGRCAPGSSAAGNWIPIIRPRCPHVADTPAAPRSARPGARRRASSSCTCSTSRSCSNRSRLAARPRSRAGSR